MRLSEIRYFVLSALVVLSWLPGCGTEEESDTPGDTGADTSETDTAEPDAGGDASTDTAPDTTTDVSIDGPSCEGPDPSMSCMDSGCPEGQVCEMVPDGCAPSACACSDGLWECTADCGPEYACVDDAPAPGCPEEMPDFRDACVEDGLACSWGMECCCGDCYPSMECTCMDGEWACGATDACFIESCAGRACETDTDCEGGGTPTSCIDGACVYDDPGCAGEDPESCEATFGCEWILPSACPEEGLDGLPEAMCAPSQYCGDDVDCPVGFTCTTLEVAPRCYWDDPLCDACNEVRAICVPTT